ncbi:acetoacetate--CoA ligase [Desulfallas thermosapovorans]|uniref:Acetoacetyl-CoA synthetase n=1 Tax=Desulfallas thermosapovorans DSM 6562 TaxID=1121431 RepID=A0A5S4ZQF3_9FIRM|nr:acetoacetate--CoA ligase [Desulfallas thermosapovorans]TYO94927.1 acetoacetyl-CoA synthetase [Desulfallas thermosapovorans DSM 6562]
MQTPLWSPSEERKQKANMTAFINYVNKKYGLNFGDYAALYDWSINHSADFWASMWEFGEVKFSRQYDEVVVDQQDMLASRWFSGAMLNFAENLLRYRDDRVALIFKGEGREPVRITYAQLYDQVARLACSLKEMGITAGDRIAGFMPNMAQTVIAMLAATSMGAIWSSCSPDFGIKGVLDRFGQIQPRVLFTANGYYYNGKSHDSLGRVANIIKEIPSVEKVVVVPYTEEQPDLSGLPNAVLFDDFLSSTPGQEIEFAQLPFDHPLYIMYSSGTTGVPKCIVHGAGGTLLQHLKELKLHTDVKREDTIFYFTTCGWMMWNWLVSSLALGATVLLYDGSPFYPEPGVLWRLAQDEKISIFGTSAKYLAALEKEGVKPGQTYDLSSLKAILSTGSPLSVESFEYVYRDIKQDVCLSSISGGTDIISCFALGNPIGPVYAGELQCRGLGMRVEALDSKGKSLLKQKGELTCVASFPSMPIYFWNDENNVKYKKAYFSVYPNIWHHGDYIEITETGGVIIYGRSDATLNPGGVRIGTAEIYRQVESLEEIKDSLVVGQNWDNDVRVILFVKLAENVILTDALVNKIKSTIRENTTPRHVPAKIIAVEDIPYTISGKKVELAVRNIIHNEPVENRDALANPEALDLYKDLADLQV